MLGKMQRVFSGRLTPACLLGATVFLATTTPAHAHGITLGIVAILLGSLALQFIAIPAVILLAGVFKGRRMRYLVPYILFLAAYHLGVLDHLPAELFIFPIIPVLVLAILYVVAWNSRREGGMETPTDDLEGPLDRQP